MTDNPLQSLDMRQSLQAPLLPNRVLHALQELIIDGRLRPGDRIIEDEIARELGVSRTSLREAMLMLEGAGLLTRGEGRTAGRKVTELSDQDVVELYELLSILEGDAAAQACLVADSDRHAELDALVEQMNHVDDQNAYQDLNLKFHQTLVTDCSNKRLLEMYRSTINQVRWIWNLEIAQAVDPATSQRQHIEILAAFRARDAERVRTLLRAHLQRGVAIVTEISHDVSHDHGSRRKS